MKTKEKEINSQCHFEGRNPHQNLINKCRICSNDGTKTKPRYGLKSTLRSLAFGSSFRMTMQRYSELKVKNSKNTSIKDWILRFAYAQLKMTVSALALTLVLCLCIASETQAEKTCDCGKVSPTDCCWEVKDGTIYITGSGEMKDYEAANPSVAPWTSSNSEIKNVNIQGVSSVGDYAFIGMHLKNCVIGNSVKTIKEDAFHTNDFTVLNLPESLEDIRYGAFAANHLTSVIFPDSIKKIGELSFLANPLQYIIFPDTLIKMEGRGLNPTDLNVLRNLQIFCKGDTAKCQEQVKKFTYFNFGGGTIDLSDNVHLATDSMCNNGEYYYTGSECIKEPDVSKRICEYERTGYIKVGNYCASPEVTYAKKRYTPAEAAQWLNEDDNTVILTFKK